MVKYTTGTVHPRIRGSKSVMEWLKDSAPCKEKSSLREGEGGGEHLKLVSISERGKG